MRSGRRRALREGAALEGKSPAGLLLSLPPQPALFLSFPGRFNGACAGLPGQLHLTGSARMRFQAGWTFPRLAAHLTT